MPFYRDLNAADADDRRTIERLLLLRAQMADPDHGIPEKTLEGTLLLASWNIRDFDSASFGSRSREAMHYIAEIIDRFDIVAVQEVNRDLTGLRRVLELLGPMWKFLVTDVTEGVPGNRERLAFLYDSRKVRLGGIVGELVLPGDARQLARTPYIVAFVAGWARFFLTTVHITWGTDDAAPAERVAEIDAVAGLLAARARERDAWSRAMVLLGDFNIFSTDDATFGALTRHGFEVPTELVAAASNAGRDRHFDQIAFLRDPERLVGTGRAGVFDYYQSVFTEQDLADVYTDLRTASGERPADPRRYYLTQWRTHQMSDHLPLWCEITIDFSAAYLERRLAGASRGDAGIVAAGRAADPAAPRT
ncbi:endonuclease/exonuclease/phosphatase family protein [Demequina iriomotensis]|uniref:endonuclease/exonuclease/phosphatase family protein n=1 Tax=Demequina iriomotensis TaxID=1536641 RepID=UPI000780ABC5|nr:endonuclease/exonuclease/phosphatase family protein [Demequina iriomotensis]